MHNSKGKAETSDFQLTDLKGSDNAVVQEMGTPHPTPPKVAKERIYFPNLNGLRFIAAFLVILHHVEQYKSINKMDNYWTVSFFVVIGKLGVVLFFVLSGFLITYLLLAEEKTSNTISIKSFYLRRIFRIWPLYFLIVVLAFAVLPHIPLFTLPGYGKDVVYSQLLLKLSLFTIFFPNLVLYCVGVVPYASQTWSIGTEEQFYLIWPVLVKRFKNHRLVLLISIAVIYFLIAKFLNSHYSDIVPGKKYIKGFWNSFNIDCMAIGGIYAYFHFAKHKMLKYLLNTYLFYTCIVAVLCLMIKGVMFSAAPYEVYAILFGLIILNFAVNPNIRISLENKVLNYLGNISYGLYMYHLIAIALVIALSIKLHVTSNWFIYPSTLLITIALAGLSYKYFETPFLKLKKRYSVILSGNDSKKSS